MKHRRAQVLGVSIVAAALLVVAGCSDNASQAKPNDDQTETTTQAKPGSARIVSFDVPQSAACGGATSTTVNVTYATEGAAKIALRVDGRPIPEATLPGATLPVQVRCDPLPHDVVIVLEDDAGGLTSDERLLTTEL